MSKKIASLGIKLYCENVEYIQYNTRYALMDYDIIIIYLYSAPLIENTSYWKKEIDNFLKQGKNIYFFLLPNRENIYDILPFSFFNLEVKNGKVVEKQQASVLDKFYEIYKNNFSYYITYSQTNPKSKIIFTGTDKNHALGSILEHESKSYCILLPSLNIIRIDMDNGSNLYLASNYSDIFIKTITDIDCKLSKGCKTPPPEWTQNIIYSSSIEKDTKDNIEKIENDIQQLEQNKEQFNITLDKEQELKGLLFETGTPLENIVIESLKILGYTAGNFKNANGDEIDVILESPEGFIYCGECEGKENKAIDVNKFRQLLDHINVYEEHLNNDTNVYGILFGNAYRLQDVETRNENFTKACIDRANKKNIILIRTSDLYPIVQYIREYNNDEEFVKQCRKVIHSSLGTIVQFPNIPNKN